MSQQLESPIQLQSDTLSALPGGGIRTVPVTVMVAGVPTTVQMQVITLADGAGVLFEQPNQDVLREVCDHLKQIKQILAIAYGQAVFEQTSVDAIHG